MNNKGFTAVLAVLVVVAILVVADIWFYNIRQSAHSPIVPVSSVPTGTTSGACAITNASQTYNNERMGYNFTIPSGYRLALSIASFINATSAYPISNWSATNTDEIVLTASSPAEEANFLQSLQSGAVSWNDPTALTSTIYVLTNTQHISDFEAVMKPQNGFPGIQYQNMTVGGLPAIQYITPDGKMERVIVSYAGSGTMTDDQPVKSIFISIGKSSNGEFDVPALNSILNSFCYY